MSTKKTKLAGELIRKVMEVHRKISVLDEERLYPFLIIRPSLRGSLLGVPGKPGEERRFTFFALPDDLVEANKYLTSGKSEKLEELLHFQVYMVPPEDIPESWARLLKKAGFPLSPGSPAPYLFARKERKIYKTETETLRLFLVLLDGTLKAMEKGLFTLADPALHKTPPLLVLLGNSLEPGVELHIPPEALAGTSLEEYMGVTSLRVPAPGDLDAWMGEDQDLVQLMVEFLEEKEGVKHRALTRFFGSLEASMEAMEKDPIAPGAFLEWFFVDYRPTVRSRTLAEKIPEKDMSPAQKILLLARAKASPSIYKVESVEKSGAVRVADLFTGRTFQVMDKALAETANPQLYLFGRIYQAGDFHFFQTMGPILEAALADRALDHLESLGMEFTPQGMRTRSHLFGRLFDWAFDQYERMKAGPVLQNTDGDPLVRHSAAFEAADYQALERALSRRKDMDYEQKTGEWIWFRDISRDPRLMGDRLTLGRIRVFGTEVLLETNSERRYKKGRKILEKIPGVAFKSLSKKPITKEGLEKLPLDDKLPGPKKEEKIPAEVFQAMKEHFHEFYMRWLDEPLPALQGKTPRQACATKRGRLRVAAMIRAIPAPTVPGGKRIPIPKKEMLKELGLE